MKEIEPHEKGSGPRLIGTTELANVLGVSARRVRQLSAEGIIPRPDSRGRHDLAGAVQAVVANARAGREGSELSAARKDLLGLKSKKEAIEIARLDRELISMDEHNAVIDALAGTFTAAMGALPARLGGKDIALRRKIEAEIDAFRTEIAEKVTELAGNGPEED